MKKLFLLLLLAGFVVSETYAQENVTVQKTTETTVIGDVESEKAENYAADQENKAVESKSESYKKSCSGKALSKGCCASAKASGKSCCASKKSAKAKSCSKSSSSASAVKEEVEEKVTKEVQTKAASIETKPEGR